MNQSGFHPAPRDPRDVLRENPLAGTGVDPRLESQVEELLGKTEAWLRRRIKRRARDTGLDEDDLRQEVWLSLLRRATVVEVLNPGVRSWLSNRVEWTIIDMLRRRGREHSVAPAELEAANQDVPDPDPTPEEASIRARLGVEELIGLGLTRAQAEVVALRCRGDDMPLKEFSELVRRSHAGVRQELKRGLNKIENLFRLTPREADVVRSWRRYGSTAAAAPRLNLTTTEFSRILEDAHKKIDMILNEREGKL